MLRVKVVPPLVLNAPELGVVVRDAVGVARPAGARSLRLSYQTTAMFPVAVQEILGRNWLLAPWSSFTAPARPGAPLSRSAAT
jgi:hypothetical protein